MPRYFRTQQVTGTADDLSGSPVAGAQIPYSYLSPSGVTPRYVGPFGRLNFPQDLYQPFDDSGLVYVADGSNGKIRVYDLVNRTLVSLAFTVPGGHTFDFAQNICPFDVYGDELLLIDGSWNLVYRVARAGGAASVFAGTYNSYVYSGDAGPATAASFEYPQGPRQGHQSYRGYTLGHTPVCYWICGEAAGTTLADASGGAAQSLQGGSIAATGAGIPGDLWHTAVSDSSGTWYAQADLSAAQNNRLASAINFSLRAWIYLAGSDSGQGVMALVNTTGGFDSPEIIVSPTTIRFAFNGTSHLDATVSSMAGGWHAIIGSWDGTNRRIYLDGSQVATDAPTAPSLGTGPFRVSLKHTPNSTHNLEGRLAHPALYNYNYNASASGDYTQGIDPLGGAVYICDEPASVIRRVTGDGNINLYAGTVDDFDFADGAALAAAKFRAPQYIVSDLATPHPTLYVADAGNNCVRQILTSTDTVSTVAGVGNVQGFSGDTGPATAAHLNNPTGLFYLFGTIYVTDSGNQRVRFFTVGGDIFTVYGGGLTDPLVGCPAPATNLALSSLFAVSQGPGFTCILSNNELVVQDGTGNDPAFTTRAAVGDDLGGYAGDGLVSAYGGFIDAPAGVAAGDVGGAFGAVTIAPADLDPPGGVYRWDFLTGSRYTTAYHWSSLYPVALTTLLATVSTPTTVPMTLDLTDVLGGPLASPATVTVFIDRDSQITGFTQQVLRRKGRSAASTTEVAFLMVPTSLLDAGRLYGYQIDGDFKGWFVAPDGGGRINDSANARDAAPPDQTMATTDNIGLVDTDDTGDNSGYSATPNLTAGLDHLWYAINHGNRPTLAPATRFHSPDVSQKDTLETIIARIAALEEHTYPTFGPFHVFA